MAMISDILLVAGALGAGFYCFVLSKRLSRFNDLEKGVGGAVAVLSAQVDDMTKTLQNSQAAAVESGDILANVTERAESVAQRMELMIASMHDLPAAEPVAAVLQDRIEPDVEEQAVEPEPFVFSRHAAHEANL